MTNGSTELLFKGLQSKLQSFTMNDFCIIFIGEEDFQTTRDYFGKIIFIRESLRSIKHTNIIICSPTFKYNSGSLMYNWRVENFNNLLYMDILTHEHAYFLDSNRNLSCDYKMFRRRTGSINNSGMVTIFKDVLNYIHDIIQSNMTTEDTCTNDINLENNETDQFFRCK